MFLSFCFLNLNNVIFFSFQFIACIGMVIWNFTVKQEDVTVQILVFIFLYSSLYSTYLWTGMIFLGRTRCSIKD